jgi:hypothetical protein
MARTPRARLRGSMIERGGNWDHPAHAGVMRRRSERF